jgi:hypothetical protein
LFQLFLLGSFVTIICIRRVETKQEAQIPSEITLTGSTLLKNRFLSARAVAFA